MIQQIQAEADRVMVGLEAESLVTTRRTQALVTMEGFEGDRHAGMTRLSDSRTPHYKRGTVIRNSRQVSIVAVEELAEVARQLGLPRLEPEWLGANLSLTGLSNLTDLPPTTRLFFPREVVLVVEAENTPCIGPGHVIQSQYPARPDLAPQFPKAAIRRRGLVAWVERPGLIVEGDRVKIEVPKQVIYSFPAARPLSQAEVKVKSEF